MYKLKLQTQYHIYEHSKENKILSINITKHVPGLRDENYKMPMKEIKEDLNKDILCSWIGKLYIVKLSSLPNLSVA